MKNKSIEYFITMFFIVLPTMAYFYIGYISQDNFDNVYKVIKYYMPWKETYYIVITILDFINFCICIIFSIRLLLKLKNSILHMKIAVIISYITSLILRISLCDILLVSVDSFLITSGTAGFVIRLIFLSQIAIDGNEFIFKRKNIKNRTDCNNKDKYQKNNANYNNNTQSSHYDEKTYQHNTDYNKNSYQNDTNYNKNKSDKYQNIEDDIKMAFQIFDASPDVTLEEIKKKRTILIKIFHPDKYEHDKDMQKYAEEKTKEINEAFDILKKFYEARSKTV